MTYWLVRADEVVVVLSRGSGGGSISSSRWKGSANPHTHNSCLDQPNLQGGVSLGEPASDNTASSTTCESAAAERPGFGG